MRGGFHVGRCHYTVIYEMHVRGFTISANYPSSKRAPFDTGHSHDPMCPGSGDSNSSLSISPMSSSPWEEQMRLPLSLEWHRA